MGCGVSKRPRLISDGKQITTSGNLVPATHWGISGVQLFELYEELKRHPEWQPNESVRSFVKRLIEPNYTDGRSVALSRNDKDPLSIRFLVSHCWEEPVGQFFEDVLLIAGHIKEGIFICFLCVYQGTDKEILSQVTQGSSDIEEGCFAQILQHVKRERGQLWVISNEALIEAGQGIYSRLWCGWEAYNALRHGVSIRIHPFRGTSKHLFGSGGTSTFSLRNGGCGPPANKKEADIENERQIREAVEKGVGWRNVDETIRGVSEWTQDECRCDFEGLPLGNEGAQRVAAAISQESWKWSILDLIGTGIDDEGCEHLAKALENSTMITQVNLGRNNIGSSGRRALFDVKRIRPALLINGTEDNCKRRSWTPDVDGFQVNISDLDGEVKRSVNVNHGDTIRNLREKIVAEQALYDERNKTKRNDPDREEFAKDVAKVRIYFGYESKEPVDDDAHLVRGVYRIDVNSIKCTIPLYSVD